MGQQRTTRRQYDGSAGAHDPAADQGQRFGGFVGQRSACFQADGEVTDRSVVLDRSWEVEAAEPITNLGPDGLEPTVGLDAGPPEAGRVGAGLDQAGAEVVVVGLLAAVLEE